MPAAENPPPKLDELERQMIATRERLSKKVRTLSEKVVEMGQGAVDAVARSIEGVDRTNHALREAFDHVATDAADIVKSVLDVRRHVRNYPWLAVGCAAALGFACSRTFER